MNASFFLMIDDPSRVAEGRRIATQVAEGEGMPPEAVSNAAIVASELATNLLKHARRGELHIAPLSGARRSRNRDSVAGPWAWNLKCEPTALRMVILRREPPAPGSARSAGCRMYSIFAHTPAKAP